VREAIHLARAEHEAAAQLERILPQVMLPVAGRSRTLARGLVFGAQQVQQVGAAKPNRPVGDALFVNQQRKPDAGLIAKDARIIPVTESDSSQIGAQLAEGGLVFAQLRDVLAAKDSPVVP